MRFGFRELVFILLLLAMPVASFFFVFKPRNEQIREARTEIRDKQEKLRQLTAATLSLELELLASGRAVRVEIAGALPADLRGEKLELLVAVVETGLETPVKRGENGGRTLRNDHVVRRLEKVGRIEPGEGGAFHESVEIALAAGWARPNLSAVAFVQESRSLAIRGAASQTLPFDGRHPPEEGEL